MRINNKVLGILIIGCAALYVMAATDIISSPNNIAIKATGDTNDYLEFATDTNVPVVLIKGGVQQEYRPGKMLRTHIWLLTCCPNTSGKDGGLGEHQTYT